MNAHRESSVAVVLAAHGDRGGPAPNAGLAAHVAALLERYKFKHVSGGVLNGEPSLEDALAQAERSGAEWILVYPMFMSAGYFVTQVLPERTKAADLKVLTSILQPFGLDRRVPLLMLESALKLAKSAGLDPAATRLLVVGHGSKSGSENAESTKKAARSLAPHSPFARIETAFLEEAPFIADALGRYARSSVAAGFFFSAGMHGSDDIPAVIEESGTRTLYTGPIGLHPRVPELIASSVRRALEEPEAADAPAAETAPKTGPAAPPGDAPTLEPEAAATPSRRARRGRGQPMRFLLKAAFTLAMMALLAIAAIAFLVPQDVVRDQVAALFKQQTGRDLSVGGKTSFALFPNVGVELEDVSVSNPQGMKAGRTLRMDALNLNLKLLPLLKRRVEVERFVLVRPVFDLLIDAQGRKNWDLQKQSAALPTVGLGNTASLKSAPPAPMMRAQASGLVGGVVQDISLGTAKIIDGIVNYSDERLGTRYRVDAVNVTLVQPRLSEPLDAEGSLVWQGEKVSFDGRVTEVLSLLRDTQTKARIALSTRHGKGRFDGRVALAPAISANGAVSGESPSLRALANWLGNPLPPGGGLGPAAVSGHLGIEGQSVTFTKAKFSLDGMSGKGQASVRLQGVRPHVTASLALDKLDINPYLQGAPAGSPSAARPPEPKPAPPAAPTGPTPKAETQQSLTDLIKKLEKSDTGQGAPRPQVRAWSQRAIDLTGLRAVDADVKLTTGALFYRKIRTGQTALTATLKSGVLNADLTRMKLYSGAGTGRVTLNGARSVPAVAALFNLNGISALPMLKDAMNFDWISGRANLAVSLSGTGRSQSELMRSLQGQGQLVFADGAIEGINIPAMVRSLGKGQLDGWRRQEREKTDFSQLSGSFLMQKGIAYNKDLKLVGPLIRMTGEGNVDIGRERIDYAALPRIVATLQGQGATEDRQGLAVPVRITGPLAKPKIVPDLERLLRDPELAKETASKVGKVLEKLKNKEDVNKLLQGVLGGGNPGPADGTQPQGEQARPEDLLKQFLR